jgi:hypothetical protein
MAYLATMSAAGFGPYHAGDWKCSGDFATAHTVGLADD